MRAIIHSSSCYTLWVDISLVCLCVFFFKQKTAYEMRISDWSSDVCSSDLRARIRPRLPDRRPRLSDPDRPKSGPGERSPGPFSLPLGLPFTGELACSHRCRLRLVDRKRTCLNSCP